MLRPGDGRGSRRGGGESRPRKREPVAEERRLPICRVERPADLGPAVAPVKSQGDERLCQREATRLVAPPGLEKPERPRDERRRFALKRHERDSGGLGVRADIDAVHVRVAVVPRAVRAAALAEHPHCLGTSGRVGRAEDLRCEENPARRLHPRVRVGRPAPAVAAVPVAVAALAHRRGALRDRALERTGAGFADHRGRARRAPRRSGSRVGRPGRRSLRRVAAPPRATPGQLHRRAPERRSRSARPRGRRRRRSRIHRSPSGRRRAPPAKRSCNRSICSHFTALSARGGQTFV